MTATSYTHHAYSSSESPDLAPLINSMARWMTGWRPVVKKRPDKWHGACPVCGRSGAKAKILGPQSIEWSCPGRCDPAEIDRLADERLSAGAAHWLTSPGKWHEEGCPRAQLRPLEFVRLSAVLNGTDAPEFGPSDPDAPEYAGTWMDRERTFVTLRRQIRGVA